MFYELLERKIVENKKMSMRDLRVCSTSMAKMFRDSLIISQIFLSPQVKQLLYYYLPKKMLNNFLMS